jgi:hypothetical protein
VCEPERRFAAAAERERRGVEREDDEVEERHQRALPEAAHLQARPAREQRDRARLGLADDERGGARVEPRVRVEEEQPRTPRLARELRAGEGLPAPAGGQPAGSDEAHARVASRVLAHELRRLIFRVVVVDENLAHARPLRERGVEAGGDVGLLVARGYQYRHGARS